MHFFTNVVLVCVGASIAIQRELYSIVVLQRTKNCTIDLKHCRITVGINYSDHLVVGDGPALTCVCMWCADSFLKELGGGARNFH